jgi:hypothetical protein
MIKQHSSGPVPPTQGPLGGRRQNELPAADPHDSTNEFLWTICGSFAIGAGLAGLIVWFSWDPFVWLLTRLFTS